MADQKPTKEPKVFGRWTVLRQAGRLRGHAYVRCICECGAEKDVRVSRLISGTSQSCGCLRNDNLTTHGRTKKSIRRASHEYWIWNAMKQRCNNPKNRGYKNYGARGITVCKQWLRFANFLKDMGHKPEGKSLERRDNNKGYSPKNCVWADRKTQNSNRRNNRYIEARGSSRTLTEWSRIAGVSHATIIARLGAGWPESIAATAPKGARASAIQTPSRAQRVNSRSMSVSSR